MRLEETKTVPIDDEPHGNKISVCEKGRKEGKRTHNTHTTRTGEKRWGSW